MQNLKDQVQELHRDLTKHHSLIKAEIMGDVLHKALQVDAQIASEYASVEGLRAVFQEVAPPKAPLSPAAPPVRAGGLPPDRKWRGGGEGGDSAWGPRRPSQALEPGSLLPGTQELPGSNLWF